MTDTNAMPVTAVRTDKPDIFALSGKIVITDTARLDRNFQSTRPIRYNRPLRRSRSIPCNRQIKRNPTRSRHFGTIALGATIITNLLFDAAVTNGSIPRSATTVRIDVNLLFATIGTSKTKLIHGKTPLIVRTRTTGVTVTTGNVPLEGLICPNCPRRTTGTLRITDTR